MTSALFASAVQTSYKSNPIPIPDSFLTTPPADQPKSAVVDFAAVGLPEYVNALALTVDGALSPEECKQLIQLAEDSVPRDDGSSAWRPALVSLGVGWEAPAPGYRVSDRIIWDNQTIADRIWQRCIQAEGIKETLAEVAPDGFVKRKQGGRWKLSRLNDRLRFLKYSPNEYFKRKAIFAYPSNGTPR